MIGKGCGVGRPLLRSNHSKQTDCLALVFGRFAPIPDAKTSVEAAPKWTSIPEATKSLWMISLP
jgi:hypothetical protein